MIFEVTMATRGRDLYRVSAANIDEAVMLVETGQVTVPFAQTTIHEELEMVEEEVSSSRIRVPMTDHARALLLSHLESLTTLHTRMKDSPKAAQERVAARIEECKKALRA